MKRFRFFYRGPKDHYGIIGLWDFGVSALAKWSGRVSDCESWRHVTIGIRSPVLVHPKSAATYGQRRVTFWPPRFGHGNGNLYLGPLFVLTTFGEQTRRMSYRRFGPVEIASPRTVNPA